MQRLHYEWKSVIEGIEHRQVQKMRGLDATPRTHRCWSKMRRSNSESWHQKPNLQIVLMQPGQPLWLRYPWYGTSCSCSTLRSLHLQCLDWQGQQEDSGRFFWFFPLSHIFTIFHPPISSPSLKICNSLHQVLNVITGAWSALVSTSLYKPNRLFWQP